MTTTPTTMTTEEIQAKAEEISKRLGCKVHPLVFQVDEQGSDKVVAFVREPSRIVKQRALDATFQKGPITAGGELFEAVLIKEDSDPRVYVESPENDKFYLGASAACMELVKTSVDQFKKK